mgnify:CR=1 FL=1
MASRNKGKWTVQDLNVFIHALLKKKQMKNNELHEASSQIQKMDIKKEHYYLFEKWQIGRHLNYLIHEKYLRAYVPIRTSVFSFQGGQKLFIYQIIN